MSRALCRQSVRVQFFQYIQGINESKYYGLQMYSVFSVFILINIDIFHYRDSRLSQLFGPVCKGPDNRSSTVSDHKTKNN